MCSEVAKSLKLVEILVQNNTYFAKGSRGLPAAFFIGKIHDEKIKTLNGVLTLPIAKATGFTTHWINQVKWMRIHADIFHKAVLTKNQKKPIY